MSDYNFRPPSLSSGQIDSVVQGLYDAFVNNRDVSGQVLDFDLQVDALNSAFDLFGFESVAECVMGEVQVHSGMSRYANNFLEQLQLCAKSSFDYADKLGAFDRFVRDVAYGAQTPDAHVPDHDFRGEEREALDAPILPEIDVPPYDFDFSDLIDVAPPYKGQFERLNSSIQNLHSVMVERRVLPTEFIEAVNGAFSVLDVDAALSLKKDRFENVCGAIVVGKDVQFAFAFVHAVKGVYNSDKTAVNKRNALDIFMRNAAFNMSFAGLGGAARPRLDLK